MCKNQSQQQQQQMLQRLRKATMKSGGATNKNASPLSGIGCGVDRSCPKSVTSLPSHNVSLDHYQIGSIRNERRRLLDDTRDDEFEWYDLDAIRNRPTSSSSTTTTAIDRRIARGNRANRGGHDFRAGLIFTTERQVLKEGTKSNRFVDPSLVEKKRSGPAFEFDSLLVWTINKIGGGSSNHSNSSSSSSSSSSSHSSSGETQEDRDFFETMKTLEREVFKNNAAGSSFDDAEDDSSTSMLSDNIY